MCVGVGGVCVGDWVGDGMVVWGGLHTEKLTKEILCKFY